MNRRFFVGIGFGWMCTVLLLIGLGSIEIAQGTDRVAEAAAPATTTLITKTLSLSSPESPAGGGGGGDLGTTFSYQGMLKKNGVAFTGNCDMRFKLYDAESAVVPITTVTPLPYPVAVNNGLFTTGIDLGDQFQGQYRYLEADVSCPNSGSPSWQTLSPRQILFAAPYALSLRPGATISGTTQRGLSVVSTQSDANAIEAYAQAGSNGWGVYAVGSGRGVYGYSPNGIGVAGNALSGPTGGTGLSGFGSTGVRGTGTSYGVSGNGIVGVYGNSATSSGYGVYGFNTGGIGVFGVYSASVGGEINAGVVGSSIAGPGVLGYTSKPTVPAIQGIHTGDGPAILGSSGGAYPAIEGIRYDNGDAIGGFATGSGTGVFGSSDTGVGIIARSASGNIIEGYITSGTNRRFYVANNGSVYADGSYNCGLGSCLNTGIGADVAERIDAIETLQPGDLVEIDPAQPDRFRLARTANSTLVAGVVSTNPAVTLNNNDLADNDSGKRTDQRPLLALVGKVPVKASTENGAVHIGDLLVASSTPGHVMKASRHPEPGTVVGKALASLKSDSGVILMLVTLQ
jgi:hypothetical protein